MTRKYMFMTSRTAPGAAGATLLLAALLGGCHGTSGLTGPEPVATLEAPLAPAPAPAPTPIANRPPDAVFIPPDPQSGVAVLNVRFDMCGSKDADKDSLRFLYDFGDGAERADLSSCFATHSFGQPGLFTARICVTDGLHEVCKTFDVQVLGASTQDPPRRFAHDIGYGACPTGSTSFSDLKRITSDDEQQALLACEACMGPGACRLDLSDCAGPSYGDPAFASADQPRWGYAAGCSGAAGRVFKNGDSTTTFGRWAN